MTERRDTRNPRRQPFCDGSCGCQGGSIASECRATHPHVASCARCDALWRPEVKPRYGKVGRGRARMAV